MSNEPKEKDFPTRGARAISALAQYHPERIAAYAFFVLPYIAPGFIPAVDFKETLAATKKLLGFELFGYWLFFSEEDANDIIQKHVSNLISWKGLTHNYLPHP